MQLARVGAALARLKDDSTTGLNGCRSSAHMYCTAGAALPGLAAEDCRGPPTALGRTAATKVQSTTNAFAHTEPYHQKTARATSSGASRQCHVTRVAIAGSARSHRHMASRARGTGRS